MRDGFSFETKNPEFVTYLFVLLTAQAASFREAHSLNIAGAKDTKRHKYKIFNGSSFPLGFTRRKGEKDLVPAILPNTRNVKEVEGFQILQLIYYSSLYGSSLCSIAKAIDDHFGRTRKERSWNDHSKIRYVLDNLILFRCAFRRNGEKFFRE